MDPMLIFAGLVLLMLIAMGALIAFAMGGNRHRRSDSGQNSEPEHGRETGKQEKRS